MTTLTVSQVNRYIKSILDENEPLRRVYVVGEISNFKHHIPSGHMYFTLKDSSSQLKCVMFSYSNTHLKFKPEDGMSVICFGNISAFEREGTYQLYVTSMQPNGVGSLSVAFEQLKDKLDKKGYFRQENKKPIPKYPNRIGVITSNSGAAVEDIKNVISRRYPLAEINIIPTSVQGADSADDIALSIAFADRLNFDVLIVGRGGGSIEDLWSFNTEIVAQAVYDCNTPIISAVGHETDFTICDFVSDLRAPTPSAAAELVTVDIKDEFVYIDKMYSAITKRFESKVQKEELRLDTIKKHSPLADIDKIFDTHYEKIKTVKEKLVSTMTADLDERQKLLESKAVLLNTVNPLSVLSRGFSLTYKDNAVIHCTKDVKKGDEITTLVRNGHIKSIITEVDSDE